MTTNFELKLAISRPILSPISWRLSVCNKCARSTLDWSQSKIFLVRLYQQTLPNTYLHSSYRPTLQLSRDDDDDDDERMNFNVA